MTYYYFAGAHTAEGYTDFSHNQLDDLGRIIYLTGATSFVIASILEEIRDKWICFSDSIEVWIDPLSTESISGIINTTDNMAIINGVVHTNQHISAPGVVEQTIDLSTLFNQELLSEQKEAILQLEKETNHFLSLAHQSFNDGLKIHDQLEEVYIEALDFEKANQLAEDLIHTLFSNETTKTNTTTSKHRFLGASTGDGVIDFIPNLTQNIKKRLLIKGRAGSGKSTLMKKILKEATIRGFSTQVYHCGFDPSSFDMVIIPELSIAIFDSTAPHEHEPEKHNDQIIDLYQMTIEEGTDERHRESIQSLTLQYKHHIQEGIYFLNQAKKARNKKAHIYTQALDPKEREEHVNMIIKR
ncbi:hypothetical protein SAMN05421734_10730 [Pelagirhabdus alkalitolerans]|uniref:NACHT domain-containing protein n=1 Tax=Pelagirhabdus alkalitolerans TaxID=1612202 RepID=A0A1G6KYH8_9BACI|nr:hypothetical protein [Pelagirhabdus alkalitolerans]SDC36024.1 hypothetical protein SAMN05421734_10730 [Pelagirhabdus alkalitolerans]